MRLSGLLLLAVRSRSHDMDRRHVTRDPLRVTSSGLIHSQYQVEQTFTHTIGIYFISQLQHCITDT